MREMMLDQYYTLKGWDVKTGLPTKESLEKIGLKEIAKELEERYFLVIRH